MLTSFYINLVLCVSFCFPLVCCSLGVSPGSLSLWPARMWVSPTSLLLFNKYTYMQLRSPKGNLSEFSPNIIVESVFGQSGLGSLVHLNFLLKRSEERRVGKEC